MKPLTLLATAVVALLGATALPALAAKPLVYCADASPEGFDPGMWDSASTNTANNQMFQGLLAFKRGTTELQPQLASSWQVSADAKTFTFGRFTDPQHAFNKAFPALFVYPQNMGLAQLLDGECQVAAAVRDVDLAALDGKPDIAVQKLQALNISYLSFNMKKATTDQREVREALDIAVDRVAIFKALFPRGDAMQAVSAFPSAIPGYNKKLKNEFNPERARQLLAKAGFAKGLEIDLWALPVARPTNQNGQLMAQLIQQDWAKIGVKANIETYEWGEYLKRANNGEHSVYMSGWSGETGDADEFLTPNRSCAANQSSVKFCNKDFDRLIDEARATPDAKKRLALYEKAQEIFKRERHWITMARSTVYFPIRRDVAGFVMAPNGSVNFENVQRK